MILGYLLPVHLNISVITLLHDNIKVGPTFRIVSVVVVVVAVAAVVVDNEYAISNGQESQLARVICDGYDVVSDRGVRV